MSELTGVTITGLDDWCKCEDIQRLSIEYPFVEWGILFPSSVIPYSGRFITQNHLITILSEVQANFSAHFCSSLVDAIHAGFMPLEESLYQRFSRVQINTHGEMYDCPSDDFVKLLLDDFHTEFIFQLDNRAGTRDFITFNHLPNVAGLHDLSHGGGHLPSEWPSHRSGFVDCHIGYAGGLGPSNVIEETKKIEYAAGDLSFWIDMETHVRTGWRLDLIKVEKVLSLIGEVYF